MLVRDYYYFYPIYAVCTTIKDNLRKAWTAVQSLCGGTDTLPNECTCIHRVSWTSIPKTSIGSSSFRSTGTTSFVLPAAVPNDAKEVLLYVIVNVGSSGPRDARSDIKLYTEEGANKYEQYIGIHTYGQSAWSTNSDNLWFPMTSNRRVYMQVPRTHSGNVDIQIYVVGYR